MAAFTENIQIFSPVCFFIIEGTIKSESEVKSVLLKGGGFREHFISSLVTHVITDQPITDSKSILDDECDAVIVNSDWVLLSLKCGALLPTQPFEMIRNNKLFTGLVFCPTQVTTEDRDKLWAMITYYGGTYQQILNTKVTHLIALEPKGPKYTEAIKHSNIKVITPLWIIDCIRDKELLNENDYLPILSPSTVCTLTVSSSKIEREDNKINNGVTGRRPSYKRSRRRKRRRKSGKEQPSLEEIDEDTFATTNDTLISTNNMEKSVTMETQDTKVTVETPVTMETSDIKVPKISPDTLITDTHHGIHIAMETHNPQHGSLSRLESVAESIMEDEDQHKPIILKCSLSLKNVKSKGDTISPTPQPTPSPMINNKDIIKTGSLLQDMVFCIVDYTDLMEKDTILQWGEAITNHGGKLLDHYNSEECTHLLAQNKTTSEYLQAFTDLKCIASAHWLNDVLSQQKMFPPSEPLHFPLAYQKPPSWSQNMSVTVTNYIGKEREMIHDMINISGLTYTGHMSNSYTTHLISKSPKGRKYDKASHWNITVTNATFISDIMHRGQLPDAKLPKYTELGRSDEFHSSRSTEAVNILKAWKQFISQYSTTHSDLLDIETCQSCFKDDLFDESTHGNRDVTTELLVDKKGKERNTVIEEKKKPSVLFTGLSTVLVKKYIQCVVKLGGVIASDITNCTHLVAPRIARTVKFLCAMSICDYIISTRWIDDSMKKEHLIDPVNYILRDEEAEEMYSMSIDTSLKRASQRKLLEGLYIYSTPNVTPSYDSMSKIVESAGGKLLTKTQLEELYGNDMTKRPHPSLNLIVITCQDDITLCHKYHTLNIPLYNAEFILTGILRQKLTYDQNMITLSTTP